MRTPGRASLDLRSLLVGVVLGAGTNLLTADPDGWWGPLRVVNRYAVVWFPVVLAGVIAWELGQRWRERRRVPWTRTDSPYPGLEAFAEDRAEVFFGRTEEIRDAVRALVAARSPAQRVLTVVGPSGCGKSSFLAAGVLPALRRRRWAVIGPLRLGSSPFIALAHALCPPPEADGNADRRSQAVVRFARRLRQEAADPRELLAALRAAQGQRTRLVLAVDQFEDLVRMADPAERDAFLGLLRTAVRAHPPLHVVLTLPAGLLRAPALRQRGGLPRTRFPLGALTLRQTRAVITGPARAAGVAIADDVVDDLVVEATEGDALPLLGQLLRDLYEAAGADRVIGPELLARSGPLAQAIARHAEAACARVVAEHSADRVAAVLLRFVAWDERGLSRRPVRGSSLDAESLAVVEELRRARLVTDVDEGEAFDLVHEALLRHWPRLRALTEHHQDLLRTVTDLERRAAAWVANGRSADDLLHGRRLAQAADLVGSHGTTEVLADLVAASRARATTAAEARADDLAERAQQTYALRGDRESALALSAAAVREFAVTEKAASTLWGVARGPAVEPLGFGHAGNVLALGWDAATGNLRTIGSEGDVCSWTEHGDLVGHQPLCSGPVRGAALSGDGTACWLVLESGGLLVRRFDGPDFSAVARDTGGLGDPVLGLTHDGWRAAARLGSREVDIIDLTPLALGRRPEVRRSFEAASASALTWSPDATLLAIHAWRELVVVRASDGSPVWRLPQGDDARPGTRWFAWAPDSRRTAEVTGRRLRIRAAADGTVVDEWDVGVAADGVFWSPDGRLVAVAAARAERRTDDAAIAVWRVGDRAPLRRLGTHWGAEEVAWRPDSTCFAWRTFAGSGVWIGDHGSRSPRALPVGPLGSVSSEAGRVAVTLRGGDAVYVTDQGAGWRTVPTARETKPVSVAWRPGGDRLAVSFHGGSVEILDPVSGRCAVALSTAYAMVDDVVWSPDGSFLATVSHDFLTVDTGIEIWEPRSGHRVATAEGTEHCTAAPAWSPDGRRLVTAEKDGSLVVLDARTGRRLLGIPLDGAVAGTACWSPDGRRVACLDGESTVRIRAGDDGTPLARSAAGYGRPAVLRWSPDGRLLATAGDRWVAFWHGETGECQAVSELACRVPREAYWSEDGRSFVVVGEDHRRYTWSLPDRMDLRGCEDLLERSEVETREPTAEERRRHGLPPERPGAAS